MKAEIYQNGPISCGMHATDNFKKYKGGIFSEHEENPILNHEVEVVGWGHDDTEGDYWIARNVWGTFWGEFGYFRISMDKDNLGIEKECTAATPSF